MRDDDEGIFRGLHPSEEFCNRTERIDIESALDLIEDDIPGIEELHLEDLDLPFLSPTKPDIQVPIQERFGNSKLFRERCQIPSAKKRGKSFRTSGKIPVMDRPEVLSKPYPPDFRDILEREEESVMTAFVRGHSNQILPVECHGPLFYAVLRMSHECERERGLPAPVLPEKVISFS